MSLRVVIFGLLVVLLGSTGRATPIMWESNDDLEGWNSVGHVATVFRSGAGGNPDGFLQLLFNVEEPPAAQILSDEVEHSVINQGDYGSLIVSFDYFGTNSASQALYFRSGDGSIWGYDFSPLTTGWEHFDISFINQSGWEYLFGDTTDYAVARDNMTLFGFMIQTPSGSGTYTFGVDNLDFNLTTQVPEPSTVMMLLSVILCLLVTFRVDRFIVLPGWIKRLKHR